MPPQEGEKQSLIAMAEAKEEELQRAREAIENMQAEAATERAAAEEASGATAAELQAPHAPL